MNWPFNILVLITVQDTSESESDGLILLPDHTIVSLHNMFSLTCGGIWRPRKI